MITHRTHVTILLALAVAMLAACGATPAAAPATATAVAPTAIPAAFPAAITDVAGRQVTVKAQPQRIVSLAPSITELLFAVGAGDQVVGVTSYCNFPSEAATREKIGGYSAKTISIEKIVALRPDVVFAESGIHTDVISALEPLGVTVVALKPLTFEDVYSTMTLLGRLTGRNEGAAAAVAAMQKRIKAVVDRVATLPTDKRVAVFWEIWDEPLMTAGPNTFPGQIMKMVGAANIFADVTKDWPEVSAEEIVKRAPAVIMGPDSHGDKLTPDVIAKRPGWASIPAVANKRIYLIDGDTSSRPGPRLADALEETAKALYPDLFK